MKRITFSRQQILHAIHAACVALFFAACAGHANATPDVGPGFTVSGTSVSGSGSHSATYFYDNSATGYSMTIDSTAKLNNTGSGYTHLIQFDHGSISNSGSLYGVNNSNSDAIKLFTTTNAPTITDSFTNSGYVDGAHSGFYQYNDITGGASASTYITVSNFGAIKATGTTDSDYGVNFYPANRNTTGNLVNKITVSNAQGASISGYYGVGGDAYNDGVSGNTTNSFTLTNSGYILSTSTSTSSGAGVYFYNEDENGGVANLSITDSITLNNTATGNINGSSSQYGVELYNDNYEDYNTLVTSENVSLTNSNSISGGQDGTYSGNYNYEVGYDASGSSITATASLTNSGRIVGESNSGSYIYNNTQYSGYDTAGSGNMVSSIAVTNTNSGYIGGEGAGLTAENQAYDNYNGGLTSNTISLINAGVIVDNGSEGAYLYNYSYENYYDTSEVNTITVANTGELYGGDGLDAENYSYYSGRYNGASVTNTITVNNTGSGYITGRGNYGIFAENYTRYASYDAGAPNPVSNTITINNSGSVYGRSESAIYAENFSENNYGDVTNAIAITNTSSSGFERTGVFSYDSTAMSAYNVNKDSYANTVNTIQMTNTGSLYGSEEGMNAYNRSYDNDGSAINKIAILNTGSMYGDGDGIDAENQVDYGTDATNTMVVSNSGYVGGNGDGLYLYNHVYDNSGTASNTMTVFNSGSIYAYSDSGIYAENKVSHVSGATTSTMQITNVGSIYSRKGDGIDAYSYVDSPGSTSTSTISIVNGTAGSIYGGKEDGIYVENSTSGTYSSSVTNAGQISGSNYGIYFDSGNSSLLTTGGKISGSEYSVYLNGGNSSVTVQGRTVMAGTIEGDNANGNTLNLNLVTSPTVAANLKAYIADGHTASGHYLVSPGYNYVWDGFGGAGSGVIVNALSLEQNVDSGLQAAATLIDNKGLPAYAGPNSPGAQYDQFYAAAWANPEAAMNTLVGREINQGIDSIELNIVTTLTSDLDQHLDNILTGNQIAGFDVGGIHVSQAGSMYAMGDTTSQLESLLHLAGTSVLGGSEMSTDGKTMVSAAPQPSWGVWASGNVTLGDESASNTLSGFHSTLGSPTLGVDYRVTPNLVMGILGSYTTGDASFGDGSKIGSNVELAALYGTWRSGNWHVNGIVGGGSSQFNDHRTTIGGLTANSTPRGDEILTDWTGGYDFHLGNRWNVTPEVGLGYTHVDVDSFSESGAGAFDLNVGDQNIDSLRSHVGFKVDKAYSLGKDLTVIPEVRAMWYHEFLDDSRGVSTGLAGAPALGSFSVNTFSPQRDFALVGAGLNTAFTGYKGVPVGLFLNYNCQVGQDDYIANSVNAGIRVDF